MARKKVRLAYIANESARRTSLKKRMSGLSKKVSELTTLCDTKASIIIYSPDETEPLVWPSHAEVQQQIGEFQNKPKYERIRKTMNQETYLREKDTKIQQHTRRLHLRSKEIEVNKVMHQVDQGKRLDELSLVEQEGLIWFMEEKMNQIRRRQQVLFGPLEGQNHGDLPFSSQGRANDLTTPISSDMSTNFGGDDHGRTISESFLRDQWFNDMNHNELNNAASSNSIRGVMGFSGHPFAAIHAAKDLGLPQNLMGGSSYVATDMGLPPMAFRPQPSATNQMGLPNYGSVRRKNFGPSGSGIGLGQPPFVVSELEQPFVTFGGASNNGASSDTELPFRGNT